MSSLEDIRQRKLEDLMRTQEHAAQQEGARQEYMQQVEAQKEMLLKKVLSQEAKTRLTNLKISNPELAEKVTSLVLYIYQSGKASNINDEEFKQILIKLKETKRERTITRK